MMVRGGAAAGRGAGRGGRGQRPRCHARRNGEAEDGAASVVVAAAARSKKMHAKQNMPKKVYTLSIATIL